MADIKGREQAQSGGPEYGRRLQEVAPGEFAPEVYVRDALSAATGMGRAYIIGSGRIVLTVAGNVRALVTNPTGSGRNVTVVGLTGFATGTGWANVYLNPTAGLPATAVRPFLGLHPAGDTPITQMRVDTDAAVALSGGTDTGVVIALPGGVPREIKPIGKTLVPGQSLGLNVPFAASADVAFSLFLVEE